MTIQEIENYPEYVWMGYRFEHVEDYPCGELCRIMGLRDAEERIAPEITKSALEGTYVLFSSHINQYTKREHRPTAELLNSILQGCL